MTAMDETIRVEMTQAEKADAGERLARMMAERQALVDAKKKAAKEADEDIEELDTQILDVATDLREGRKEKRQGDLFHEEKPAPAEVGPMLGEIAARAEALPSEPHAFEDMGLDTCARCQSGEADPVHQVGTIVTSLDDSVDARRVCKHCHVTAADLGPVGMWQHCPAHEGGSLTHELVDSDEIPPEPDEAPDPASTAQWEAHTFREDDNKPGACAVCGGASGLAVHNDAEAVADQPVAEPPPRGRGRKRRAGASA